MEDYDPAQYAKKLSGSRTVWILVLGETTTKTRPEELGRPCHGQHLSSVPAPLLLKIPLDAVCLFAVLDDPALRADLQNLAGHQILDDLGQQLHNLRVPQRGQRDGSPRQQEVTCKAGLEGWCCSSKTWMRARVYDTRVAFLPNGLLNYASPQISKQRLLLGLGPCKCSAVTSVSIPYRLVRMS